jgi:cyclophilin family peptidyl-prolyl cis-trans isomerase
MRSRVTVVLLVAGIIAVAVFLPQFRKWADSLVPNPGPSPTNPADLVASDASPGPSPLASTTPGIPGASKASNQNPDLTMDANGLSKATVVMTTSAGTIKFKFYPKQAPDTVNRFIELINKEKNPNTGELGFYNGLTFHRVIPGFIVQGGDPLGNGTGGSGKKLKAEFNGRRHVEGAVAMARAQDPDSADSQFYFTLGTFPHLDRSYTIFGQVTEGMDVVKNLKIGDKMLNVIVE